MIEKIRMIYWMTRATAIQIGRFQSLAFQALLGRVILSTIRWEDVATDSGYKLQQATPLLYRIVKLEAPHDGQRRQPDQPTTSDA